MRCFIAAFLTPDSASRVVAARPKTAQGRVVPEKNLHVTLHFLGSVAVSRRTVVLALVASLEGERTAATIEALTGFPSPNRARVWVARLSVDERIHDWVASLRAGWPTAEGRRFHPHLTLARGRALGLPEADALVGMSLSLEAPAAYVSETLREGARYTRLA